MDLSDNHIGPEGASEIAKALEKNTTLTHLEFWQNNIGFEGTIAIANALKKNTTLTSLNLAFNDIDSRGAAELSKMLEKNITLTSLELETNNIESEGAKVIIRALLKNYTLTELELYDNHIDEIYQNEIQALLQRNQRLAKLKQDLSESAKKTTLTFSNQATEIVIGTHKPPVEFKIEYTQLCKGLEYFSNYADTSNGEIIDPVWFPENPSGAVKKQIYHKEFIQGVFYHAKSTVVRCPFTRDFIDQEGMVPHSQFLLFRNIFILATRNAIYKDKTEYNEKNIMEKLETLRIIQVWDTLSPEAIKEAEEGLKNVIAHKPTGLEPEQIEFLNGWGIGQKLSSELEVKSESKAELKPIF